MEVGDEDETLQLLLKFEAHLEGADVVAQVQGPGGPVAGEHPLPGGVDGELGHVSLPLEWPPWPL